jgi:hypothetical protein
MHVTIHTRIKPTPHARDTCKPRAQTRALSDRAAELKARHAAAVGGLLSRYKQLRGEVGRYNSGLQAVVASGGVAGLSMSAGRDAAPGAAGGARADVFGGRDQ